MNYGENMKEICSLARKKGFKAKSVSTAVTYNYYLEGKSVLVNDTCVYLLLCEIQKWIREDFDIHIEVTSHKYKIKELNGIPRTYKYNHSKENYSTYFEALQAGIKETLKEKKS